MQIYQIQVIKCSVCTLYIFEYHHKNNNKKLKTTINQTQERKFFGKSNCGFSRNVVFLDYLLQLLATENLNFKLSLSQVNEPQK